MVLSESCLLINSLKPITQKATSGWQNFGSLKDADSAHFTCAGIRWHPTLVGNRPSQYNVWKGPSSESGHNLQHTCVSAWNLLFPSLIFRSTAGSSVCKTLQNIGNKLVALLELKAKPWDKKTERKLFLGYCDRASGHITTPIAQPSGVPGLPVLVITTVFALVWPYCQDCRRWAIDMPLALKPNSSGLPLTIPCNCCHLLFSLEIIKIPK